MIKFIERNKEIISILSAVALFGILSNNANAITVNTNKNIISEQAQPTIAPSGAFLVSKTANISKLKKYVSQDFLTDKQLKDLLYNVGFRGQHLKQAWAVSKKETNGRPYAFNKNGKTGDKSYGLFQINMLRDLGPDRIKKFGLSDNQDLFNPVINAQVAYYMSKGGKDWSAWHGITSKTKEWMKKFPTSK
jgi:hypothetical protein